MLMLDGILYLGVHKKMWLQKSTIAPLNVLLSTIKGVIERLNYRIVRLNQIALLRLQMFKFVVIMWVAFKSYN